MAEPIDRARVEALTLVLVKALMPDLAMFPPSRDDAFIVLNALAITVGTVLAGADRNARRFFDKALAGQMELVRREEGGQLYSPRPGHA